MNTTNPRQAPRPLWIVYMHRCIYGHGDWLCWLYRRDGNGILFANDVDEMIIIKSMEKVMMGPLVWEPRRAVPEDRKC